MCDILIIVFTAMKVGAFAERKGRSKAGFAVMGVGLCLGLGILGAIVGLIAGGATGAGNNDDFPIFAAAGWIVGLLFGCGLSFGIVAMLPEVERRRRYDDEDDYDRPRRRRRRRDRDEEDDYDDPPPRRRDDGDDYDPYEDRIKR